MGDPRKQKKKYSKPAHPWQATRLEEEAVIVKNYALKNKREVWKSASFIKNIKHKAKELIASTKPQARKEEKEILQKLVKLKLLPKEAKIEDALDLSITTVLERRLQTMVYKKGLARTPKQARQLIIHRHITIKGKRINIPSYIVTEEEEPFIQFSPQSSFFNEDHPERAIKKEEIKSKIEDEEQKHEKIEESKDAK